MPARPPKSLQQMSPFDFLSGAAVVSPELGGEEFLQKAASGRGATMLGQATAKGKAMLDTLGKKAAALIGPPADELIGNIVKMAEQTFRTSHKTASETRIGAPEILKTVQNALELAIQAGEHGMGDDARLWRHLQGVAESLANALPQLEKSKLGFEEGMSKPFDMRLFDAVRRGDLTPEQAQMILKQHKGPPAAPKVLEQAAEPPKVLKESAAPGSVTRRRAGVESPVGPSAAPAASAAAPAAADTFAPITGIGEQMSPEEAAFLDDMLKDQAARDAKRARKK